MEIDTCDTPTVIFLKNLIQINDLKYKIHFFHNDTYKVEIKFYNKIVCVTVKKAIDIFKDTMNQDNEVWMQHRKIRITASECYNLYTYTLNKTPIGQKKIQNYFKQPNQNKYMKLGKVKEIICD